MKATFFSIAALAATALAAPFRPEARQIGDINAVGDALEIVDGVAVDDLGVGEIANNVIDTPLKRADVANVGDVIILITSLTEGVTTHTGAISTSKLRGLQGLLQEV